MSSTLETKENEIISLFADCSNPEAVYNKIIEIGQKVRKVDCAYADEANLVPGCQSKLYLHTELVDDKLLFQAHSDALISMGLAQLLVRYFSGESAETILKQPPSFLEKLNIPNSLTPSRANGLYNIHLRMKQSALKTLVSPT